MLEFDSIFIFILKFFTITFWFIYSIGRHEELRSSLLSGIHTLSPDCIILVCKFVIYTLLFSLNTHHIDISFSCIIPSSVIYNIWSMLYITVILSYRDVLYKFWVRNIHTETNMLKLLFYISSQRTFTTIYQLYILYNYIFSINVHLRPTISVGYS